MDCRGCGFTGRGGGGGYRSAMPLGPLSASLSPEVRSLMCTGLSACGSLVKASIDRLIVAFLHLTISYPRATKNDDCCVAPSSRAAC